MPSRQTHDIAIVGGGHVGLATALALAELLGPELRIAVIERNPATGRAQQPDPRAFALSAGSKNLLAAIGAWPEIGAAAQPVDAIEITDSALGDAFRPVLLSYDNHVGGTHAGGAREPASWIVPAGLLSTSLATAASRATGIAVLAPRDVASVSYEPGLAEVVLSDDDRIRAALVVAADGARSRIRDAAGLGVVSWDYDQSGIVATVRHERPHEGRAVQHFLPGGPFAILPLPGNRSCITWSEKREVASRIMAGDDAAFLAETERRFGYKLGRIALDGPRAAWPLRFHMARALVAPRLALAGDAARVVHPIAGQGLNLGLRDAAALAECVADSMRCGLDAGDTTGLERYERWRRFDSSVSAAAYGALNTLFSNDSMITRAVRGAGLGIVDWLPGLKNLIVSEAAGLTGEIPRLMTDGRVPAAPPGL